MIAPNLESVEGTLFLVVDLLKLRSQSTPCAELLNASVIPVLSIVVAKVVD